MCEAILDFDDIHSLFRDLNALTRLVSIQEKGGDCRYAEHSNASLTEAMNRILERRVRAIQIRYCYENSEWTDTLICFATEIQLVRSRHQ